MNKNTEISERLLEMIDFLNVTKNDFAKSLSYNRSQAIYDMINGKSKPSFDFFEKLLNSEYSEIINIEYIITGKGILDKTKCNKNLTLSKGKEKGKEFEPKPNVIKTLPFTEVSEGGIPLIPIDAFAGFGSGEMQVMDYETSRYVVPEFTNLRVDFIIRISGDSMTPTYSSGDLVACRKLSLSDIFFQWNKVYILDTEQGALLKRIKKASLKDHIVLSSDNSAYEPFELSLSGIYAIALVIGLIRLD